MEILVKCGDKRYPDDPAYLHDWRDGQIIGIRPDGYYSGSMTRKHHAVIRTQHNFFGLIGATSYASPQFKQLYTSFLNIKKFMSGVDSKGKFPWDDAYKPSGFNTRLTRAYFIDFAKMLLDGWITKSQYDSLYNFDKEHEPIYLDRDLLSYIFREGVADRLATMKNMAIDSGGTYTVGTAQTYADWSDAIADLPADIGAMTTPGNIILSGAVDEEITESTVMTISLDTDVYTLTLQAASGVKHNGGAYGNGHRINLTGSDYFAIDEATGGTLNSLVIQDLAIDASGASNYGIYFLDGGDTGYLIAQRCVVKTDVNARNNYRIDTTVGSCVIRNCVGYGGNSSGYDAFRMNAESGSPNWYVLNNTIADSGGYNIRDASATPAGTVVVRNNIAIAGTSGDYSDPNSAWDTTEKNVSGDASSPDGATYQNWAGTASFTNYAGKDFRLASTDATLDDGDDLSGIGATIQFSDDIQGQTRSTWYIGASEYVAAGASIIPGIMHNRRQRIN